MKPIRPCHFNIGDEVTPLEPKEMSDCIGTITSIVFKPIVHNSDHWCWRVYIKLHKHWKRFEGSRPIYEIIRSDTELQKVPTRIGEITSCQ